MLDGPFPFTSPELQRGYGASPSAKWWSMGLLSLIAGKWDVGWGFIRWSSGALVSGLQCKGARDRLPGPGSWCLQLDLGALLQSSMFANVQSS